MIFSMARSYIERAGDVSIPFLFDEKPILVPGSSVGRRSGGARKVPVVPLARIQSERLRRLALASGFRLLRSFGLDRLDAAVRGWQAQMAEDLDDHRRIFNACPERVEGAEMIFKAPDTQRLRERFVSRSSSSSSSHRLALSRDRGGQAHRHLIKRGLAIDVALDVLLHRRAKPRPRAIEQTGGVEVRLVRDAIVRELLSRDLADGVEEHDVPQVVRAFV